MDGNDPEVPAFVGGGPNVDSENSAMIKETEDSLTRLIGERRGSIVRNVNRPAKRRESLVKYLGDNELN